MRGDPDVLGDSEVIWLSVDAVEVEGQKRLYPTSCERRRREQHSPSHTQLDSGLVYSNQSHKIDHGVYLYGIHTHAISVLTLLTGLCVPDGGESF